MKYETIFIAKSQLSDGEIGELIENTKKIITKDGGSILAEDKWGRRRLSYPIGRERDGFYVYLKYDGNNQTLKGLSHYFKVNESVIREMTVVASEKRNPPKKKRTPPAAATTVPAGTSAAPAAPASGPTTITGTIKS